MPNSRAISSPRAFSEFPPGPFSAGRRTGSTTSGGPSGEGSSGSSFSSSVIAAVRLRREAQALRRVSVFVYGIFGDARDAVNDDVASPAVKDQLDFPRVVSPAAWRPPPCQVSQPTIVRRGLA